MVLIILMAVDITTLLPALSDCKEMDLNGYEDCEHYPEVTTIATIIGLVIVLALNIYFWFCSLRVYLELKKNDTNPV